MITTAQHSQWQQDGFFIIRGAQRVTMAPGDLLVFHSHLMHRSRDNISKGLRAAMVYHLAAHGTLDQSKTNSPVNGWMRLPDATETTEINHDQT